MISRNQASTKMYCLSSQAEKLSQTREYIISSVHYNGSFVLLALMKSKCCMCGFYLV